MFEGMDVAALVDQLVGVVTQYGLRMIGALAILIVGRMVAGAIRRSVVKGLTKRNLDATLIPFVGGLLYWLVMAVVLIAVLNAFGAQPTGLVAILGAAGLAVGLALQGTLSNFASGVMLLIFRPFGVQDVIDVDGTEAIVRSIGLFSTTLDTKDNIRLIMPNSQIFGTTIKNYTANDTRRVDMVIGVSYDDDLSIAKETIDRIVKADPLVLTEPATTVEVVELGDSSVNFVVRPWVRTSDYWTVRFALTRALKDGVEEAGCSFPYPQRDVHTYEAG